jgi:hypothetical protein
MSVAIVRTFVQLREMLAELETKLEGHDEAIRNLSDAIRQLIDLAAPAQGRKMSFNQTRE